MNQQPSLSQRLTLHGAGALIVAIFGFLGAASALAQDATGCTDHPAITRYPGSVLAWCKIENYMPYEIPVGPVTGYRAIDEWVETEGRVTRNFYSLVGERTHSEVYKNFKDALEKAGFEIIADGLYPERNVRGGIGGGSWQSIFYAANAWSEQGAVGKLVSGTSSSGGTGAVFGKKERAENTLYVMVSLEQHSSQEVAVLIDVVETESAETGLVTADAEAMGRDIEEYGRTVLVGLFFDHDSATLQPASEPALSEIARLLANTPDKTFYIVGHTDATGTYAYNMQLSADRAEAVRSALVNDHGIDSARLQSAGVGPLSPVFSNGSDAGRAENRRVELVESR